MEKLFTLFAWNYTTRREISAYKYRSKNIRQDRLSTNGRMHVQRSIVIIRALVYTHRYLALLNLSVGSNRFSL